MARSATSHPPSEAPYILVSLLNTRAAANRSEKLADPASATAWLADQGLLPLDPEVTQAEWQRLLDLREGLYTLLLAPRRLWTSEAARQFNRTIRDVPIEVSVTLERSFRLASPERTFDGAIGRIVSLMVDSFIQDRLRKIKACANGECLRVFYDDSRNGRRRWCSQRCGDRIRMRNHRRAVRHGRI